MIGEDLARWYSEGNRIVESLWTLATGLGLGLVTAGLLLSGYTRLLCKKKTLG